MVCNGCVRRNDEFLVRYLCCAGGKVEDNVVEYSKSRES